MKYVIIIPPKIETIKITDDNSSIDIDVTVTYNLDSGSQLPNGTTGYTINMLLDSSLRNTMLSELNTKVQQKFDAQFNILQN